MLQKFVRLYEREREREGYFVGKYDIQSHSVSAYLFVFVLSYLFLLFVSLNFNLSVSSYHSVCWSVPVLLISLHHSFSQFVFLCVSLTHSFFSVFCLSSLSPPPPLSLSLLLFLYVCHTFFLLCLLSLFSFSPSPHLSLSLLLILYVCLSFTIYMHIHYFTSLLVDLVYPLQDVALHQRSPLLSV